MYINACAEYVVNKPCLTNLACMPLGVFVHTHTHTHTHTLIDRQTGRERGKETNKQVKQLEMILLNQKRKLPA